MFKRSLSFKYLRTFGCKDIGIIKSEFVAKTEIQFLRLIIKIRLKETSDKFSIIIQQVLFYILF